MNANENNDTQKYLPDTSDDESTGNGLLVGIVAGVSIVLSAVLAYTLVMGGDEVTETTETSVVEVVEEPATLPAVSVPTPERIDPELTAWNEEKGPEIGKLLAVLSAPPVRDVTLLRFRCKQMLAPLANLEDGARPTNPEVAEAFDVWLRSVRDAVTFCIEGSQDLPDSEALPIAGSNLGSTGVFWDTFFQTMAQHVDLTGKPQETAPSAP